MLIFHCTRPSAFSQEDAARLTYIHLKFWSEGSAEQHRGMKKAKTILLQLFYKHFFPTYISGKLYLPRYKKTLRIRKAVFPTKNWHFIFVCIVCIVAECPENFTACTPSVFKLLAIWGLVRQYPLGEIQCLRDNNIQTHLRTFIAIANRKTDKVLVI